MKRREKIIMAAPKKTVKSAAKAADAVKSESVTAASKVEEQTVAAPEAEEKTPAAAPEEAAVKAPKTEEKKAEHKKPGRKPKAATTEAAKATEDEKKTPAKKTVKKADQKSSLHIQFSGKSYSQEDLVKIAQDVWKYDLKQKVRELASIELYVKPEENMVYYVMNQKFTGSFVI